MRRKELHCEREDNELFATAYAYPEPVLEKARDVWKLGKLTFRANFESANLAVVKAGQLPGEYQLWTRHDCHGTVHQTHHRSWFYFGVTGMEKGDHIVMTIMNLNKQVRLFGQGYRPVFRVHPSMKQWAFLPTRSTYDSDIGNFRLRMPFKSDVGPEEELFLAFAIPFSYSDNQRLMGAIAARFERAAAVISEAMDSSSNIYCRRQTLVHSLQGRCCDLLTVSDMQGGGQGAAMEPPLDALHSLAPRSSTPVHAFPDKKVIFISARVHPGETPGSHLFNGILAFLLRRTDARAALIRRRWVLKLVPIVNPDGVANGHYRMDTLGQNLNRYYDSPNKLAQPTVYAIRQMLLYYARQQRLDLYIDLHAHANKRGVFTFGNALEGEELLAMLTYCKLCALNSPHFTFPHCNFTEKNMSSRDKDGSTKEGAGRVALYRLTGLAHLYTVEANYNSARTLNCIEAPSTSPGDPRTSPQSRTSSPVPFLAHVLRSVGRSLLVGFLDLQGINPWSRLPQSSFKDAEGVRRWVLQQLKVSQVERKPGERPAVPKESAMPALSPISLESLQSIPLPKRAPPAKADSSRGGRQLQHAHSCAVPSGKGAAAGTGSGGSGRQAGLSRSSSLLSGGESAPAMRLRPTLPSPTGGPELAASAGGEVGDAEAQSDDASSTASDEQKLPGSSSCGGDEPATSPPTGRAPAARPRGKSLAGAALRKGGATAGRKRGAARGSNNMAADGMEASAEPSTAEEAETEAVHPAVGPKGGGSRRRGVGSGRQPADASGEGSDRGPSAVPSAAGGRQQGPDPLLLSEVQGRGLGRRGSHVEEPGAGARPLSGGAPPSRMPLQVNHVRCGVLEVYRHVGGPTCPLEQPAAASQAQQQQQQQQQQAAKPRGAAVQMLAGSSFFSAAAPGAGPGSVRDASFKATILRIAKQAAAASLHLQQTPGHARPGGRPQCGSHSEHSSPARQRTASPHASQFSPSRCSCGGGGGAAQMPTRSSLTDTPSTVHTFAATIPAGACSPCSPPSPGPSGFPGGAPFSPRSRGGGTAGGDGSGSGCWPEMPVAAASSAQLHGSGPRGSGTPPGSEVSSCSAGAAAAPLISIHAYTAHALGSPLCKAADGLASGSTGCAASAAASTLNRPMSPPPCGNPPMPPSSAGWPGLSPFLEHSLPNMPPIAVSKPLSTKLPEPMSKHVDLPQYVQPGSLLPKAPRKSPAASGVA